MSDLKPCYMDMNGQRKKVDAYMDINGVRTKISSAEQQLPAPTISISGDTLQITDSSGLATSFDILVDGVVKSNIAVESGIEKLPTPTLIYQNGVLTIIDNSGLSTNYELIIRNTTTGSTTGHGGGAN